MRLVRSLSDDQAGREARLARCDPAHRVVAREEVHADLAAVHLQLASIDLDRHAAPILGHRPHRIRPANKRTAGQTCGCAASGGRRAATLPRDARGALHDCGRVADRDANTATTAATSGASAIARRAATLAAVLARRVVPGADGGARRAPRPALDCAGVAAGVAARRTRHSRVLERRWCARGRLLPGRTLGGARSDAARPLGIRARREAARAQREAADQASDEDGRLHLLLPRGRPWLPRRRQPHATHHLRRPRASPAAASRAAALALSRPRAAAISTGATIASAVASATTATSAAAVSVAATPTANAPTAASRAATFHAASPTATPVTATTHPSAAASASTAALAASALAAASEPAEPTAPAGTPST